MKTIETHELKARLDAGEPMTIVEALPPSYFEAEHLPGAINIPQDRVRQRAMMDLPDTQATIVVYCANTACGASADAARALAGLGYRNVIEYVDGKEAWKEAGYPLESGTLARSA